MSNINAQIPAYKAATVLFWGFAWKVFVGISVVVTVVSSFSNFEYLKEHPLRAGISITALTVFVSLLLLVRRLISKGLEVKPPIILSAELVNIVNTLYVETRYLDVVRFGSTFSRYLWLNGHNHERIAIGKLVEDAASKVGRTAVQVSCLIDDIGWTSEIIGDTAKAVANITNGIEKAVENELFYLAAKGERHLSGIEKHRGNSELFILHLTNAKKYS